MDVPIPCVYVSRLAPIAANVFSLFGCFWLVEQYLICQGLSFI